MILGIETSGLLCSIAWYENDRILLEYNIEKEQVHSTILADLFNSGLNYLDKTVNDISLAAIATGPGSYTGLRIGMSFMKGLCFGNNIPVIGISNFNVLALQSIINDGSFFTLINANKGRFYYAKFENKTAEFSDTGITEIENANQIFSENAGIVFDYYSDINEKIEPWNKYTWLSRGRFNASYLCRAAEYRFGKYGANDLNDLEPMYLQAFAGIV
jgi:tRNA threonylcarbamoyladenosine biosynthesis protein TsaB